MRSRNLVICEIDVSQILARTEENVRKTENSIIVIVITQTLKEKSVKFLFTNQRVSTTNLWDYRAALFAYWILRE